MSQRASCGPDPVPTTHRSERLPPCLRSIKNNDLLYIENTKFLLNHSKIPLETKWTQLLPTRTFHNEGRTKLWESG